ncbi:DUF6174 domain-containing protein [Streptomyces spectabilis]|uniref:Lipoprotein n=1 Tax=Streptomyces spectabilis TaxID=68270 RepID=A0A516RJ22_STRST|nr:DUF6174 domain-containing protein [Streptomyces spectabilis]QDQ15661.1 hypothetical protein FH965_38155 [Streptomyces spectabilis]
MTTARSRVPVRFLASAALVVGVSGATAACGDEPSANAVRAKPLPVSSAGGAGWKEPSSYAYTLRSGEGERSLIGTFRVTVRDGKVRKAVGLDDSGRRVVKELPDQVPTIGALLKEAERAEREKAHRSETEYAADGHPVRITLDWEKSAIDDEALYVISAYTPLGGAAEPNG